ncbi:MAG: DNRLRE domain-containing protein [Candidatus Eisenbacteria bacterium]|uniref:DNRLRE domain-containing protein n=1 Tax=Eiseniibacteriota bacterium TaxID=2212470 RepID=A0A937XAI1_UNCEI|nr:DNRLRE domain-containing protein [Candidatus Eisenbacteria bacterium]
MGLSLPGRPVGRLLGVFLLALAAAACSEKHELLTWRDAPRGLLGEIDSLAADTLVVAESFSRVDVPTGAAGYFLAGVVDRAGGSVTAKAFLRWDLTQLPSGTIVAAHMEMHLSGVDEPEADGTGRYAVRIFEVLESWSEESLNALGPPAVDAGVPWGEATIDTTGLAAAGRVLLQPNLFAGTDPMTGLLALARRWQAADSLNHGLMLRPRSDSERAWLRFFSSEGQPSGSSAALSTPLLVLEIQGDETSTISLEAVADAYAIDVEGDPIALPEGALLVSSGLVHHAMLRLELPPPLAPAPAGRTAAYAILRGLLTLRLDTASEWRLREGESMTVSLFDADVDWGQADPWPNAALHELLDRVTVAAGDTTVAFAVGPHLQGLLEGNRRTLVLQSDSATDRLRSLVLQGAGAEASRPRIEIGFAPRLDRLGG